MNLNGIGLADSSSGNTKILQRNLRLPTRSFGGVSPASGSVKAYSAESLINIIRNFSSSNHRSPPTPSSPQISDHDISSAYPTPISTPGSPGGSLETISQSSLNSESTIQVALY